MTDHPLPTTFEDAFAELEALIAQLDTPDLPLDTAIAVYERARALATHCQSLLDTAELRLTQLDDDA